MNDGKLLELFLRVLQNHPKERDIGFCREFSPKAREELERYEWGGDKDKEDYSKRHNKFLFPALQKPYM